MKVNVIINEYDMIGFMRVHVAIYDYEGRFVLECRMFFVEISFVCVCLSVCLFYWTA